MQPLRVFSLASQPKRQANLTTIIPVLLQQADVLHIHWVGYGANRPTEFNDPKIIHHEWETAGSQIKFYSYNQYPKAYFFTVDDDIRYPVDYADKLIANMQLYNNKVVCCVHANNPNLKQKSDFFNVNRQNINFKNALRTNRRMLIPGTGTACFYTPHAKIRFEQFKVNNMSDIQTGCMLAKQHIPVVAIQRDDLWMEPMPEYGIRIFGNNPHKAIDREINRHKLYFHFNRYWFKLRYQL